MTDFVDLEMLADRLFTTLTYDHLTAAQCYAVLGMTEGLLHSSTSMAVTKEVLEKKKVAVD